MLRYFSAITHYLMCNTFSASHTILQYVIEVGDYCCSIISIILNALRITQRRHLIQRHLRSCNAYICTCIGICAYDICAPIGYTSNRRSPDPTSEFCNGHRTFIFSFLQLPWEDTVTRTRVSTQRAAYASTFRVSFINIPI